MTTSSRSKYIDQCACTKVIFELQDTYRYHGHSISDPGSTYRTRDEISGIRRARDPIEHVKTLLTENNFAEGSDLKKREKQIKREVRQLRQLEQN